MLLVITQGREKEVIEIFNSWGLDGVIIGQVTANPDWRIFWEQQLIASLPATSLATIMPVYDRPQRPLPSVARLSDLRQYEVVYQDIAKVFEKLLTAPNLASRRWVYRQFDHMVRTNTIGLPGGDAAVVRIKETRKAVAMTVDGNGRYCQIDPYQGAQLAVAESCRNLVVSGARPWAITNGLNLGSPEKGENMTALSAIIDGIAVACRALTVPVTGGNVSLYNETDGQSIYPTPIIGAVGVIDDYFKQLTTPGWKQPGDRIILLGKTQASLGGSEYLSLIYQQECGPLPVVDFETEHAVQASCLAAIQQGLITAAHDIAEGGLLLALAECSLQSRGQLGAVIQLSQELLGALPPPAPLAALLFGESPSRIIVSVRPDNFSTLARLLTEYGVEYCDIGITGGADFVVNLDTQPIVHCPLTDLYQAWSMALTQAIEG
jgi:phosphoribosylformylglycinamidine synthase